MTDHVMSQQQSEHVTKMIHILLKVILELLPVASALGKVPQEIVNLKG